LSKEILAAELSLKREGQSK